MKIETVKKIQCSYCSSDRFTVSESESSSVEIRSGEVVCQKCNQSFPVENGILNMLHNPSETIQKEQKGHIQMDHHGIGVSFKNSIKIFKKEFLMLPEGDNSANFKKMRYFKSVADESSAFYDALKLVKLKPESRILDSGADVCWSTAKFTEMGHECCAIDINHHMIASDIFIEGKNIYFERILADMNNLPFRKKTFDAVFTIGSLHHTEDLINTVKNFHKVLDDKGKLILINEPINSGVNPVTDSEFGGYDYELGINEHTYKITEYYKAAHEAGFRFKLYMLNYPYAAENRVKKIIIKTLKLLNYIPVLREAVFIPLNYWRPCSMVMLYQKK